MFFHSNFPPETLQVALELVVYETMGPGNPLKSTAFAAGWALLELSIENKQRTAPFFKGTPRFLMEEGTPSIV